VEEARGTIRARTPGNPVVHPFISIRETPSVARGLGYASGDGRAASSEIPNSVRNLEETNGERSDP